MALSQESVPMNKREFLKTSGALITGGELSRLVTGQPQAASRTNWAGNYRYSTDRLDLPETVEEVQNFVKSHSKLKALGTQPSFNRIDDGTGGQISLKHLDLLTT